MKSSLMKLRGFVLHKGEAKEKRGKPPGPKLDELVQATQDMQDMRSCYDGLLSAAAATANSAYEFSEALQEMGACLTEKTSLNEDDESGRGLLMLGKVQFELQKLVDSYRTHVIQTITKPSESLLRELQTVEEMQRQCDNKRDIHKFMSTAHIEKGTTKNAKRETFSLKQVQAAQEDYEEEATLFIFRLKSLKQGQSRSLLTQASRHHAAQLRFFRKGLKSLEMVEPHIRDVAANQHIDYHFTGLEDNGAEDDDSDDSSFADSEDGELRFDYGQNNHGADANSMPMNSMEIDQAEMLGAPATHVELAQETSGRNKADLFMKNKGSGAVSQSAPIFPDKKFDPCDKMKERQPSSTRKFHTYALPTPVDVKAAPLPSLGGPSPIAQSVLKETNTNSGPFKTSTPLAEELSEPQSGQRIAGGTEKVKRNVHSGPLPSTTQSGKPIFLAHRVAGLVSIRQPSFSSKVSPSASPPPVSSPKISELHELPRPPDSFGRPTRPSSLVGHSAPLVPRSQEHLTSRISNASSINASPLPTPAMVRSLSIPTSGRRTLTVLAAEKLGTSNRSNTAANVFSSSPPTHVSLSGSLPISATSETVAKSVIYKGV